MKYSYEYRKIRSTYEVTILAHSSANIILGNQYIPEGCLGILDPLEFNKRYGIYGTRQILNAGDNEIKLRLVNRTSEMMSFETRFIFAELRIININQILEDAEAE